SQGWEFEGADASFKLLVQRVLGQQVKLFELASARTINEWRGDGEWTTEATLKINVDGQERHTAAEGDGPVHALDRALRKALLEFYPAMEKIHLTDFKVRVVNTREGTAAQVRVLVESTDGVDSWSTVGVSTNIIEASWLALRESIEFGLTR